MPIAKESSYNGQLKSLGGVLGTMNFGRQVETDSLTADTTARVLVPENLRRLSLLFQNTGAQIVYWSVHTGSYMAVLPGQSAQIDENFPWTGAVEVITAAGSSDVLWTEVSVQ